MVPVVMKSFERLMVNHLNRLTGLCSPPTGKTDPKMMQSTWNCTAYCNTSATRILFLDFSLVFKTIIPETLHQKFILLRVSVSICQSIIRFLTDRRQLVSWGASLPAPGPSVLEPPQGVTCPHWSPPSTPITTPRGAICWWLSEIIKEQSFITAQHLWVPDLTDFNYSVKYPLSPSQSTLHTDNRVCVLRDYRVQTNPTNMFAAHHCRHSLIFSS